jgi:hypothetical protein
LENLESGLHDLDLLAVRDPYKDGVNEVGDSIRYSTLAHMDTNNILVEGLTSPPAQLVSLKPMVAGELERESIFDASPNRKLTNELGNIPLWIEGEGKPGGTLPFYLHFNSGVHDEEGDVIAVSAFLNYEQIPLYHEAEAYLPLYIERQAGTWQVLPVNIRLPETPGTYELVITARTDVFSLLELERSDRDVFGTEESNRIKITVHP